MFTFLLMLGALAWPPSATQAPADRLIRIVELELTEPTFSHSVEHAIDFEGDLRVFGVSDLDFALEVESSRTDARREESESQPFVRLAVQPGDAILVRVTASHGPGRASDKVELHLVGSVENESTHAAAAAIDRALEEALDYRLGDDVEGARLRLEDAAFEVFDHPDVATSQELANALSTLGIQLAKDGGVELALRTHRLVLASRERCRPRDDLIRVNAKEILAQTLWDANDYEGALALRLEVLETYERTLAEGDTFLTGARAQLVRSLWRHGHELERAREIQETVIATFERSLQPTDRTLLSERSVLGLILDDLGQLGQARDLRAEVLALAEEAFSPDDPQLQNERTNLAISYSKLGEHELARALQVQVIETYERALPNDHPSLLAARQNLAITLAALGDAAGARALEEAVLAVYEATLPPNDPILMRSRLNLASTMSLMGDYAAARVLEEQLVAELERALPAHHVNLFQLRMNLASTLLRMNDLDAGIALMERSLDDYADQVADDHAMVLQARSNLATARWRNGERVVAYAELKSVLTALERTLPTDAPELWSHRTFLAMAMLGVGERVAARELFTRALAFFEARFPADHSDVLNVRANLALATFEVGKRELVPEQLGILLVGMQERIASALALAPRQALNFVATEERRLALALFLDGATGSKHERAVFELIETMRLVSGEAARILARFDGDPELAPILTEAARVRAQIADLMGSRIGSTAVAGGVTAELAALSIERDKLEREASRLLAERGVHARGIAVDELASQLEADSAAVSFRRIRTRRLDPESGSVVPAEPHLFAHVLTPAGDLTRLDLGAADELEELGTSWVAALGSAPGSRDVTLHIPAAAQTDPAAEIAAGAALREHLIDPLLAAAGPTARTLFVCADDWVHLIPLSSLPLAGERVGDRQRVVHEVSFARLVGASGERAMRAGLVTLGGVDFQAAGRGVEVRAASPSIGFGGTGERSAAGPTFRPIPHAEREAAAVADLFAATFGLEPVRLSGAGATKAALFEHAAGAGYMHLATHGWFASLEADSADGTNPIDGFAPMTLCGLALAGANGGRDTRGRVPGILTAEELCLLDLAGCELAVLSACETHLGVRAGQGVASLQAALHAAGARTSITSLWRVGDEATGRLMEEFYRKLWVDGLGKAEALWASKATLRAAGAPVRDWAGWVLTGDPD